MAVWLAAIALMAAGDLAVIAAGSRKARFFFKPGTMLFVIAMAVSSPQASGSFGNWVIAGLVLSLAGDVFLLWPNRFVQGLVSFFLAHLCYLVAFWSQRDEWSGAMWFLAAGLFGAGVWMSSRLRPGVIREGGKRLEGAVLLYMAAISLMVLAAFLTGHRLLIIGSLLFFLSDAVLAWNRFVQRFKAADYLVMATYFSAQTLFAASLWPV